MSVIRLKVADFVHLFRWIRFQELLFCETCDTVFCTSCIGGSHVSPDDSSGGSVAGGVPGGGSGTPTHTNNVDHTVIPFSIAIKRMSEILIYKANECRAKVSMISGC